MNIGRSWVASSDFRNLIPNVRTSGAAGPCEANNRELQAESSNISRKGPETRSWYQSSTEILKPFCAAGSLLPSQPAALEYGVFRSAVFHKNCSFSSPKGKRNCVCQSTMAAQPNFTALAYLVPAPLVLPHLLSAGLTLEMLTDTNPVCRVVSAPTQSYNCKSFFVTRAATAFKLLRLRRRHG